MGPDDIRNAELAMLYRQERASCARWAAGYGVIRHDDATQVRVHELVVELAARGMHDVDSAYRVLAAADRIASAAMWLVAHMTYARSVYRDGRDLAADDFKQHPEGHTGGSLNMVVAYAGYLAANTLTGHTRGWLMGQGHCVAAIDAVNLLVGNVSDEHAERYPLTDEGLSRFVRDFYSYEVTRGGAPASPLGSHVGPGTAGGLLEGGYLGFAELQYVHMPLPGERLVAFLSDGAFEEQRGSDWAARWWRAEDSGLVTPIMIANGRRIEQRTTMAQEGGADWLHAHLRLNGFDPFEIDGRDPSAFAWAMVEGEARLAARGRAAISRHASYPVRLPYAIAQTEKGFGFPGAGTNAAHNLPLIENPATDEAAREAFTRGARALWVPASELAEETKLICLHESQHRPRERDNVFLRRQVTAPGRPEPTWQSAGAFSPMAAIDEHFCRVVVDSPHLRARVGNPDELRSNGLSHTLDLLKHRVCVPEDGVAEAIDGKVITALNEEAVVCAALGNKGGINLVVTYEAFAPKMLGAIRQELLFARHQKSLGRPAQWISVPLVLTSHTWENGKNEQSHQDPTMSEALLGEMSDVSRVVYPADANSAVAALDAAYSSRGQIWTMVVPKRPVASVLSPLQARAAIRDGAVRLRGEGEEPLLLVAMGAYQLAACTRASDRLLASDVPHALIYLAEPGNFRIPRDAIESKHVAPTALREMLFPTSQRARVFVTHTRPEVLLGVVRPLDTGTTTRALGYRNQGGTLDTFGMELANRTTWAHVLAEAASVLGIAPTQVLTSAELGAIAGEAEVDVLR